MNVNTNNRHEKFTRTYNRYLGDVKLYFLKYTRNEMKAEDMAQDLFIRLIEYNDILVDETAKSFIFTIAHRMVIDDARHQQFVRRATKGYLLKQQENKFWQDSESIECKQIEEMEQAKIRTLPPRMAEIYCMTRFEQKTSIELATELNISKRTVETHLLKSRREIRSALRKVINM